MINRKRQWLFLSALALTLLPGLAWAQFALPQPSPLYGKSARGEAMGGVGIALDDNGKQTPFYNPAGLADIQKTMIELPFPTNFTTEFSVASFGLIQDAFDLNDDLKKAANNADKLNILNRFIQKRYNEFHTMRILIPLFSYTHRYWAAGAFAEQTTAFSFRDQSYPNFKLQALTNGGGYLSGGYGLFDQLIQGGATVRVVYRRDIAQVVDAAVVTGKGFGKTIKDDFNEGKVKVGVDLGLKSKLNPPILMDLAPYKKIHDWLRPSIGVTVQNVNQVDYSSTRDRRSVSVGAAVHPDFWKLKNTVALDLRDLDQDSPLVSKLHFGAETKFPWIVSLRAGLNQGYLAGGLGLDLWICRFDFATYAEEVGFFSRQHGDRKLVAQVSSEF